MTEPWDEPDNDGLPDKRKLDRQHNILRHSSKTGAYADKPWTPHPETGAMTFWRRPSGVGKVLEGGEALATWRGKMIARGITARQDLRARASTLDVDDHRSWAVLCEEAINAAGGSVGSATGTATHIHTERLDAGLHVDLEALPDDLAPNVRAYAGLIERYGLSFYMPELPQGLPEDESFMRERFVITLETGTGGTFDHLAWSPEWELPRILDTKTSKDPIKYPHTAAVQLAIYARARALLPKSWDWRTSTKDDYLPMPEVDLKWGHIVWVREGKAELLVVDLEAGWDAATRLVPMVKEWRAHKGLVVPYSSFGMTMIGAPLADTKPVTTAPPKPLTAAPYREHPSEHVVTARSPVLAGDSEETRAVKMERNRVAVLNDLRKGAETVVRPKPIFPGDTKPIIDDITPSQWDEAAARTRLERLVRQAKTRADMATLYNDYENQWTPELTRLGKDILSGKEPPF